MTFEKGYVRVVFLKHKKFWFHVVVFFQMNKKLVTENYKLIVCGDI